MGCTSCASGGGTPRGCQNNGTCSSGGCNKLGVFDWLGNMDLPSGQTPYDIVEVRFKNSRKSFYRNSKDISLQVGDVIVVEASPGYDVGVISVIGELARIQVKKKAPGLKSVEAKKIYRIANQEDIDKWSKAAELEKEVMYQSRTLAVNLNLNMKISDVEYQGDLTKATFYYTSEDRVDFRQLIKDMADTFKIRVEMRQIGSRQEAARLGGIGSCGRELCCSTWLTDFRSVSTSAARYQQLSLNPQKLAGQCGKLKCCLNFELDMYLDAIKSFPSIENKLYTEKGAAFHIKTDIFKRVMVYMYEGGGSGMISLSPERVAEIREMNIKKLKPQDLVDYTKQQETVVVESEYANVDEQDNLNRFDNTFKKGKKKRKPARPNAANPNQVVNANPNAKPKKVEALDSNDTQKGVNPNPAPKKSKPKPKPKITAEGDKVVTPVVAAQKEGEAGVAAPKKNKRRRPPRKDGPKTDDNPKTDE
jgi:cell fate regulator YaaT (PSP1 superfamily)